MLEYCGWIYRYHISCQIMRFSFPVLNSTIIVNAYFPYFYILGCFQTCTLFGLFRNRDLICYNVAFSSWFGSLSQGSIANRAKISLCKSHLNKTVLLLVMGGNNQRPHYIYIYAFSRRFYPKQLTTSQFRLYIFFTMCESNPQAFALQTQCSTTEPQEHYDHYMILSRYLCHNAILLQF